MDSLERLAAGDLDVIFLHDGTTLETHGPRFCMEDDNCCIHNPSVHALDHAPLNWRSDRGLMERMCSHGIGHPDPDALAFRARGKSESWARADSVHGCDGCCS